MRGERQRHSRTPNRLPRRGVDRIADVVIWMLMSLALLTGVLATSVAARRYGDEMRRVHLEARERVQVEAVLLEPTRQLLVTDERTRVVRLVPSLAPVRYTAPDGTARQADVLVKGRYPVGATVPVWVTRSGAIAGSPTRGADAVRRAAVDAGGVLVVGALVLGSIWAGLREALHRFVMAGWEREWEQVEPQWSGRPPDEPSRR